MVNQARKTGCAIKAQAAIDQRIAQLHDDMEPLTREIEKLDRLRNMSAKPIPKLKSPLDPPVSATGVYEPVAVFDGDGVCCMWENDTTDDIIDFKEWPFDQDFVYTEDAERLGFRVEPA